MLMLWLLLVAGMGGLLAYTAGSGGSLFAFLFTKTVDPEPLAPVVVKEPAPKPRPQPILTIPEEPKTVWVPLIQGTKAGKGTLGKAEITTLANGNVEIRFATSDAPGNFRAFYPHNVDSLSVDLLGSWGKNVWIDTREVRGILKRVQVADHKQWVRVSGIARDAKVTLKATVEYAPTLRQLRIVFAQK